MNLQDIILANELASDLRAQGYCSILNSNVDEDRAENIRKYLLNEFNDILYLQMDEFKKYFVINEGGKKTVLKLLESYVYNYERARINAEQQLDPSRYELENEIKRVKKMIKLVEKKIFRYRYM